MSPITTHILDIAEGQPARGVRVTLERSGADGWSSAGEGTTNDDGRVTDLLEEGAMSAGIYRLTFETKAYFEAKQAKTFYPEVVVTFCVEASAEHYHVPLLLSPFGYSTYRGS